MCKVSPNYSSLLSCKEERLCLHHLNRDESAKCNSENSDEYEISVWSMLRFYTKCLFCFFVFFLEREVLIKVEELKLEVKENRKILKAILAKLEEKGQEESLMSIDQSLPDDLAFPVDSAEDLDCLEERLQQSRDLRYKLASISVVTLLMSLSECQNWYWYKMVLDCTKMHFSYLVFVHFM